MTEVKDWILALFEENGGDLDGATRLTKLSFLIDRTLENRGHDTNFDFIQYRYGPYDDDIFEAISELQEDDLIEVTSTPTPKGVMFSYRLTDEGRRESRKALENLDNAEKGALKDTVRAWGEASTNALVSFVYDEFPEYAPS